MTEPTRPGWYFAKFSDLPIECVEVREFTSLSIPFRAYRAGIGGAYFLAAFTWFGRVPMPVEMGSYAGDEKN